MNNKCKTKIDFSNLKEMPKNVMQFNMVNPFSNLEMALIYQGHKAKDMDDKWNFYMEDNKVYLHRSWTGFCIYILEFYDDDKKINVTVNNNKEQVQFTHYDKLETFYKELEKDIYEIIINRLISDYGYNSQTRYDILTQEEFDKLVEEGKMVKY